MAFLDMVSHILFQIGEFFGELYAWGRILSRYGAIIMVSLAFLCWAYLVGTMYCAVVILNFRLRVTPPMKVLL